MPQSKSHAVLSHLTDAAQSLQAAYELARESGDEAVVAIIRRAGTLTASSISAVISPLEQQRAAEVLS